MSRILQHDDAMVLSKSAALSNSSNAVYVGGKFTITIPAGAVATVLDATSAVYLMVSNTNPIANEAGGGMGAPDAGYQGTYSENPAFAASFVNAGNLMSFTGSDGSINITYDKPVRYMALSANTEGATEGIDDCFTSALSGYVVSDYSVCKTH